MAIPTLPTGIAPLIAASVAALTAIAKASLWGWEAYQKRVLSRRIGPEIQDPDAVHRAVRYYVEPNCTSVDPAQEAEPRSLVVAEEPVMGVLDRFMEEGGPVRHMVVLADSGMGKTSLLLNYYARNLKRSALRRHRIAVVHLGLPDADERIRAIPEPGATALFLDAFDEDTRAIADHKARIGELLQLAAGFRRLLLTSRTQFFPADEEIPQSTGLLKTGARGMEAGTYEFRKLYLAPFHDPLVRKYLRKRYPGLKSGMREQAWELVQKVPLISIRPMLLTHLPDLIESDRSFQTAYQIYDELVEKWYQRESTWVDPMDLDAFSTRLAVDLFVNREERGAEQISRGELQPLARQWGIKLDDWQLRGRSLLNRDAFGNYKFAHRSIMEFIVARLLVTTSPLASKSRERYGDARDILLEYLTQAYLARLVHHSFTHPTNIDGRWVRPYSIATDQITAFLSDAINAGVVGERALHLPIPYSYLQRLLKSAQTWAKEQALRHCTGHEERTTFAWIFGPAIFTGYEARHLAAKGWAPATEVVARDHFHNLDWLVVYHSGPVPLPQLIDLSAYRIRGWKAPDWRERLSAMQMPRKVRNAVARQENESSHLPNDTELTTAILTGCGAELPLGLFNSVVYCRRAHH